ncbi:MAG: DNA mismatch repair endonuclease MutL, partial [Chloroflexota bacterium]|nr:DNA mismatch repair endonuclease MutL [Chloroflexota bacterium]
MGIRQLPEEIVARIAAGEVVERPASVIKELVENSLDAGATRIEVETRGGGQTLLRVRDNGAGILSAEAPIAFQRHATSKLASADDLFHIATLGFRGEALASIAAVSRITCTTRSAEEPAGTRLRLESGAIVSRSSIGRPPGTEILVEDLFYNVPARRKYLSSERTERRHIDAFLTRYAIAYPGVAFQVTHNGREALRTSGNGSAREVLLEVYGLELGGSLLDIPLELAADQAIRVRGFVGPTTVHRANRGYITLFINGRWVQDLRITYAIIQAYHTLLPVQRYPVAVVMVELPPEDVDINVHPAKTEVRFREADSVFRAVQRTVRATVVSEAPVAAGWQAPTPPLSATGVIAPTTRASLAGLQPARQFALPGTATPAASPSTATTASAPAAASGAAKLPPLRVVGQVATMF